MGAISDGDFKGVARIGASIAFLCGEWGEKAETWGSLGHLESVTAKGSPLNRTFILCPVRTFLKM